MTTRRTLVTGVLALGYFGGFRPRLLRWGTTAEEADATLPGDTLIARPVSSATMAVTLPAPPEQVWPWLIQMGCDRAGWYSWDRLDNGGRPSAIEIVPDWQELAVGDRLMSTPDGSSFFTAEIVHAPEVLVLRADLGLPRGNPIGPDDSASRWWIRSSWAFVLNATNDGVTRLVVRTRSIGNPAWAVRLANLVVGEPAHLVMQLRQFEGLRRRVTLPRTDAWARAERDAAMRDATGMRRHLILVRHAKSAWNDASVVDHDRPLSPRGAKALPRLRDHLTQATHPPEFVLCSTSRRTVDTLEGIRAALPQQARIETEQAVYDGRADTLLGRLQLVDGGIGCAMVIGHNPAVQDLALLLVGAGDPDMRAQLSAKLPTGAAVTLSFDGAWGDLRAGTARLDDLFMPRPPRS